jgi:hypothetical protein
MCLESDPSLHFACARQLDRLQVKADIKWHAGPLSSVENDPTRTFFGWYRDSLAARAVDQAEIGKARRLVGAHWNVRHIPLTKRYGRED